MELRPEEITKIIKSQIKNYENHIVQEEVGTVLVEVLVRIAEEMENND